MDLMVWPCRFGKERYIKQINNFWEWSKKNQQGSAAWRKNTMSEKNLVKYTLFCLGNDKNSVIANEVLTYF